MTLDTKVNYLSVVIAFSYVIAIIILCNVDIDINFRNNVVSGSIAYLFQLMLSNIILFLHQQPVQHIPLGITAGICFTSIINSVVLAMMKFEFSFQDFYIMHGLSCLNITLIGTYAIAKYPNNKTYNDFNNILWFILSLAMVFYYQEYLLSGNYDYRTIAYFLLCLPVIILGIYYWCIVMIWIIKLCQDYAVKKEETIPIRMV